MTNCGFINYESFYQTVGLMKNLVILYVSAYTYIKERPSVKKQLSVESLKGSFKNYVDKMRWTGGQKMPIFSIFSLTFFVEVGR